MIARDRLSPLTPITLLSFKILFSPRISLFLKTKLLSPVHRHAIIFTSTSTTIRAKAKLIPTTISPYLRIVSFLFREKTSKVQARLVFPSIANSRAVLGTHNNGLY